MQEENKENSSTEQKKQLEVSWCKICSWVALILSTMMPIASIGAAIVSFSFETETDGNEPKIVCFIAIAVSLFLLFNDFVLNLI